MKWLKTKNMDFVIVKIRRKSIEDGIDEDIINQIKQVYAIECSSNYNDVKKKFSDFLIDNNKNITQERFKVLEKICSEKSLFTISTIHEKVINEMHIALKTANNTFRLLVKAGIIKKVNDNNNELFNTGYFELIK